LLGESASLRAISFQHCRILANPRGGTIAATNSRYLKRTSRQRLRRSGQRLPPGGKMLGVVEQAFQQEGYQQLAVKPGAATVIPLLGQLAQSENRFQPLEMQFDLPAIMPAKREACSRHRSALRHACRSLLISPPMLFLFAFFRSGQFAGNGLITPRTMMPTQPDQTLQFGGIGPQRPMPSRYGQLAGMHPAHLAPTVQGC
jgi:hypothetical protein